MKNVCPTSNPIRLKDASGRWMVTTYEGEIDIPGLPEAAQKAQICPQLAHTSLVSVKTLVDPGCEVTFNKYKYRLNPTSRAHRQSLFEYVSIVRIDLRGKTDFNL